MANNRVFYACHYPAFRPTGGSGFIEAHGVQSMDSTTTFNQEQVFELGQIGVYSNFETVPAVEVSVEKVLDGDPLIYHLATQDATGTSLLARSNNKCDIVMSVFDDSQTSASGTPVVQALCSGMYINSLDYSIPVEGNSTESVSLSGQDKTWSNGSAYFEGHFSGNGSPSYDIQRRQHVNMGDGINSSTWPTDISGINGSGKNLEGSNGFAAHIQNVSISTSLNREDLFELGNRRKFFSAAQFPVSCTTEISVIPAGTEPGGMVDAVADNLSNTSDQTIVIKLDADDTTFDMGTKNRLTSVATSGGDSGGGEVTVTYSYENFNDFTLTATSDVASV